jgi:hypothetical protein
MDWSTRFQSLSNVASFGSDFRAPFEESTYAEPGGLLPNAKDILPPAANPYSRPDYDVFGSERRRKKGRFGAEEPKGTKVFKLESEEDKDPVDKAVKWGLGLVAVWLLFRKGQHHPVFGSAREGHKRGPS